MQIAVPVPTPRTESGVARAVASLRPATAFARWLPTLALVAAIIISPSAPRVDVRLEAITAPTAFSLLDWETSHVATRFGRLIEGLAGSSNTLSGDAAFLQSYFRAPTAQRLAMRTAAEAALDRAITQSYAEAGAVRSLPWAEAKVFPPVLTALVPPPAVLIIAPRTELRVARSVLLVANLNGAESSHLESQVESSDVSALVSPIGGIATYPAMVPDSGNALRVVTTIAHEWVHQYLIFYPLGSAYWASQEAREINETAANMVGTEIGARVVQRLGLQARPLSELPTSHPSQAESTFSFRTFMRETRAHVERLLGASRVNEAESFMETRRVELEGHGYRLRRLNQAYLAFNGSYGEGAAASPGSPVPGLLRQLRERTDSVGAFLAGVRDVTSTQDLRRLVVHTS